MDDSLAGFERSAPRFDASVEFVTAVYRKAVGDLNALRMRTTFDHHVEELLAAGLPWFMTCSGATRCSPRSRPCPSATASPGRRCAR